MASATRGASSEDRALTLRFLRAAQGSDLGEARILLDAHPWLLHAQSSSKGYTAMHYAAMAGTIPVVEWLSAQGLDVDTQSPSGATPLQVALEYKRLPAARRLQQLRDAARAGVAAPSPERAAGTDAISKPANTARVMPECELKAPAPVPTAAKNFTAAPAAKVPIVAPAAKMLTPTPAKNAPSKPIPEEDQSRAAISQPVTDLSTANRDAAQQLLESGERALSNCDLQKAVRYLRKANALQPQDEHIRTTLAAAERDLQAVLKEQVMERESRSQPEAPASRPPSVSQPSPANHPAGSQV